MKRTPIGSAAAVAPVAAGVAVVVVVATKAVSGRHNRTITRHRKTATRLLRIPSSITWRIRAYLAQ
jgi:hypothetical protein